MSKKIISIGLKKGDTGEGVVKLQSFFKKYGYLKTDSRPTALFSRTDLDQLPDATPGVFDRATQDALIAFQTYYNLVASGEVDNLTLKALNMPRCGVPDTPYGNIKTLGINDAWPRTKLTYGILEFSEKLRRVHILNSIAEALRMWSALTPLRFKYIPIKENPDFVIRFVTGDHGDGAPFDGPSGTLAHAFYPPPNAGELDGDAHFDNSENWTVNVPIGNDQFDLVTVAAHEFGHSLGLGHTNNTADIMFPAYLGPRRYLSNNDTKRIQSLYGSDAEDSGSLLSVTRGEVAMIYTKSNILDVYAGNANGGLRRHRMINDKWQKFEELGGEHGIKISVSPHVIHLPNERQIFFSFSAQKHIEYRFIDANGISTWSNINARRGAAFFTVSSSAGGAIYIASRKSPGSPPAQHKEVLPLSLYEKKFNGVSFNPWNSIEEDVTGVADVAIGNGTPDILFIASSDGYIKYAWGEAGNWGEFKTFKGDVRAHRNTPFKPIDAVFVAPDDLHLFVRTHDNNLMHKRRLNGHWQEWELLGERIINTPISLTTGNGRAHVLANTREQGAMIKTFDGNWSYWVSIGGRRYKYLISAIASQNRIDYVLRDKDKSNNCIHSFVIF